MSGRYNGWANHATWCVHLWWTNDEYNETLNNEQAEAAWSGTDEHDDNRSEEARLALAETFQERFENEVGACGFNGMVGDLLGSVISHIDWYELADACLESIDTDDGYKSYK